MTPPSRAWVAALVLAALGACSRSEPPQRIVLITVDTLRWDAFAGERAAMPRTAEAALDGLVFTHSYSASSSTQPTHATIFTGLHPWQSGVPRNGMVLADERETLAELLAREGWETYATVGSFPLHSKFGWDQGFADFRDSFDVTRDKDTWNAEELEDGFYNMAEHVVRRALEQLDSAHGVKQFFWFHFYDPHAPYGDTSSERVELVTLRNAAEAREPALPTLLELARQRYDVDVAHLDEQIGRILDRLERDASEYETHLVLTADHGESFGEDGSLGHGKRLTRPQVHVPLVVVSPRAARGTEERTVGSVDVFATVLGLAGVPRPDGTGGHDLLREGSADVAFGMRRTFANPFREQRTDGSIVMVSGRRFYRAQGGELVIGNSEALEGEAGAELPEAAELETLFGAFERELDGGSVQELLDDDTLEALEALGYTR